MSSTGAPKIVSLADLLAVAYRIEADAVERYNLLADQMETHNNPELVAGRLSQVGATPYMQAAKAVNVQMMRLLVDQAGPRRA